MVHRLFRKDKSGSWRRSSIWKRAQAACFGEKRSGEGKLYEEVELPRRDIEAGMANQLSILPNFEARCRLINNPTDGGRPKLAESHIVTELLGYGKDDAGIAARIRARSPSLALPRELVEADITRRSLGNIETEPDFSTSEPLS